MGRLKNKKILVTGGSRGIGADIARKLAEEGARVAITYTTQESKAQEVVQQLPGEGHFIFPLDISSEESIQQGLRQLLDQYKQIDGLVNNAGITRDQLLLRMKTEDFDDVIRTNLRGTFLVTKALLKPMLKARQGTIVHITSVSGQTGHAGQANYAASKAGVEAFSKSVAQEVASRGIRSNCVAPGFIVTDMTGELNEEQHKMWKERIPLGRLGHVSDISNAVSYLLSEESSYITGQTLSVNGGLYMPS